MPRYIKYGSKKIDIDQTLFELDKYEAELSLVEFIKQAWHIVEPGAPYIHGWHIDFIADHLTAITDGIELDNGRIYNRLLINVPPGTMKSLITNVFWPSWEWGPRNKPHLRYVCAAHKVENLSARDSRRMRQLITSDWYQKRWGDRVLLARDQNEKLNFVNSAQGFRIESEVAAKVVDDASEATSRVLRHVDLEATTRARRHRQARNVVDTLHHRDVVGVALRRLEQELATEGERQEILELIREEMRRS